MNDLIAMRGVEQLANGLVSALREHVKPQTKQGLARCLSR